MLTRLPNVDPEWLFESPKPGINKIPSIRESEFYVNAGHNGFASPHGYYAAAQPFAWLPRCRIPVLCIGGRNDVAAGLFVADDMWRALLSHNLNVIYICFPVGGYLGFVGDIVVEWRGGATDAERLVMQAFTQFCETLTANEQI